MIWCPRQMPNTGTLPSSSLHAVARATSTGGGIAGTVGEEHAVGLAGEHVGRGRRRGHDLDLATRCHELVEDRALDPEVVRDDEKAASSGPTVYGSAVVTSATRSLPVGAAVGLRGREQRVAVGDAERAGHRAGRRM